jgi:hypothetical protein
MCSRDLPLRRLSLQQGHPHGPRGGEGGVNELAVFASANETETIPIDCLSLIRKIRLIQISSPREIVALHPITIGPQNLCVL